MKDYLLRKLQSFKDNYNKSEFLLFKSTLDNKIAEINDNDFSIKCNSLIKDIEKNIKIDKRPKLLLTNFQSPGDIVMMTYAIKALHEQYPNQYITDVKTTSLEIWDNNPYITKLNESDNSIKKIKLEYNIINKSNSYSYRYIDGFREHLAEKLNIILKPIEFNNSIFISEKEKSYYSIIREKLGKDVPYWIINAGHKTDFTIKAWDFEKYQAIIKKFPLTTFVQIGHEDHIHPKLKGKNLINLVGKTDMRQLIRVIYNSFGVITPVSLPMVLSYSIPPHPRFEKKSRACIVIAGGREPNHWQQGPNQQYIHTCGMLKCCDFGGCWKSRVIPIGDGDEKDKNNLCEFPIKLKNGQHIAKCMDMITVSEICNLIQRYIKQ